MPSLSYTQATVRDLINQFDRGELLIPEFQRPYVWTQIQASRLLDSLYRGFPIGSLLVWNAPLQVQARKARPRKSAPAGRWLIDGQQRVTTLSRVAAGDGIDIVFNIDTGEFRVAKKSTRSDAKWISVAHAWDPAQYRELIRDNDFSQAQHKRIEALRDTMNQVIAISEMHHHDFDDATEVFKRLNTQGRRLSGADLASASIASKHSGFIRDEVAPLVDQLKKDGFDRLKITHLFRACGAIATADGRDPTALHEMSTAQMSAAWKQLKVGVKLTQDLIRSEFGLNDMRLLRSGALLVPPIVVLATRPARERPAAQLAAWIALAALFHRYSKAGETALDQDLRARNATDPVAVLLTNLRSHTRGRLLARELDFSGTLADQGALFAAYVACRESGALDPFTGQAISHHKGLEHHHVLPRATFAAKHVRDADKIANMAFVVSGSNASIGGQKASDYLVTILSKRRQSQCIPLDEVLYRPSRVEDFYRARRKLLAGSFNDAVRRRLPGRKLK